MTPPPVKTKKTNSTTKAFEKALAARPPDTGVRRLTLMPVEVAAF